MMSTWRVKSEADLPPQGPDVRVAWEKQLGEPAELGREWRAFLAEKYAQPVGGVHGERSRSFGDVLADTKSRNLGLWVTFPKPSAPNEADADESGRRSGAPSRLRCAEFKLQSSPDGDESMAIVDAIRRELSLGDGIKRFAYGSVPVFAVGDAHVVKLFPTTDRSYFDTEKAMLPRIDGRLPIPTPRLVAAGDRGPWSYVVMTRLAGCSLAEAWEAIPVPDRARLMRDVGAALAALHATVADDLAPVAVDWPRFMKARRASSRDEQIATGLKAPWVDAVDPFLARWAPRDDGARVLLHTEVMREHLLVERREGSWQVSGLLDLEDAMLGAPEYEWACAGVFLTSAEPGLLHALLEGYGAETDDELPLRIMAYALLHRHTCLRWYLERLPVRVELGNLEALARSWFTP